MKRLRTLAIAAVLAAPIGAMSAQSTTVPFTTGDRVATVGFMTGGDYDGSGLGGMVEWGVLSLTQKVHLGIGGFVGFQRNKETVGSFSASTTVIPLMAQGNLHFPVAAQPRLDLFAGASIGLVRVSADCTGCTTAGVDASNTDSGVGIQGGARFNLLSSLSVVGQVGFGDLPLLFAGVSFKF